MNKLNFEQNVFNQLSRRSFLKKTSLGLGTIALNSMLNPSALAANPLNGLLGSGHFPAKAKRVIFLCQAGGPSQLESFDYKPKLVDLHGQEIPPEVMGTQQVSGMVASQTTFPLVKSAFDFYQYGESGAWVSELFPHTAKMVDDLCFIKSMQSDQINHEPAVMLLQTGFQLNGRPSIGSWVNYGLGSDNNNLPGFVTMVSKGKSPSQPISAAAWSNGFLPSHHQGVQFRSGKDPVLYLNNPEGVDMRSRRNALDAIVDLNKMQQEKWMDPAISSKIADYEMAYRMQMSVPEVVDLSKEPDYIFDMYGEDARTPGTYAANCLLARRLAEQDVKFIQLYHTGWDHHGDLPKHMKTQAKETDQASAALIQDLKMRGMLDDTLVIWGGEFGRTSFSQGQLTATSYGRDHHIKAFTYWMAGGGVKPGFSYGETDDYSYNVVKDPVHIYDFQATLLHLLGIDHTKLTYKFQGRRFRLTEVHGHVVKSILA